MKKVFICSPYRGNIENNINKVKYYCKDIFEQGYLPIAPHLYFPQFLDDDNDYERKSGILMGKELLSECDEIWVFGEQTEGMKEEIEFAKLKQKIIKYFKGEINV